MAKRKAKEEKSAEQAIEEAGIESVSEALSLDAVDVQVTSSSSTADEDTNLVKVLIKYPDGYKNKKFFADGDIKYASKESAQIFVENGYGTIIE